MSRIVRIRITTNRAPGSWRVLELGCAQSLHVLHEGILCAFGFDRVHLYSFHLGRTLWNRATEIGGAGSGAMRRAEHTTLGELGLVPGAELYYVYDYFEEHLFRLLVLALDEAAPGVAYPRQAEAHGPAPLQYTWELGTPFGLRDEIDRLDVELGSAPQGHGHSAGAAEAEMAGLETLWPALARVRQVSCRWRERSPTRPELGEACRLAAEIRDGLGERGESLRSAGVPGEDLLEWIANLAVELEQAGLVSEALELCDRYASLADELAFPFLVEKASILTRQGRREAALRQLGQNLARYPDDGLMARHAADLYLALDELGAAERCYRRCLEEAQAFEDDRIESLRRLASILARDAREEEGRLLIRDLERRERRFKRPSPVRTSPPFRRRGDSAAPASLRATPAEACPCGSGRPYRRCCMN
jgi:tetratricopeptide (TPR) repeat protein